MSAYSLGIVSVLLSVCAFGISVFNFVRLSKLRGSTASQAAA